LDNSPSLSKKNVPSFWGFMPSSQENNLLHNIPSGL
jgi:hypothetical protein